MKKKMNWAERITRKGNFTLHSGAKTDTKFDCSELSPGDISRLSVTLRIHHFRFNQPVSLLGIAYGGITLAYEIASTYHYPFAIYTKEGDIRGNLPTKGVVIVDDVITTGRSVFCAANALDLQGLPTKDEHEVVAIISLIRRFDISTRPLPWPHFYLCSYSADGLKMNKETVMKQPKHRGAIMNFKSNDRVIQRITGERGIIQDEDPMKSNIFTGTAPMKRDWVYVAWLWPETRGHWENPKDLKLVEK